MNSLNQYITTPANERLLFLQMLGMLTLTGLALKIFEFRRVFGILDRLSRVQTLQASPQDAACPELAIRWKRYAKRNGYGTCLSRSLVLWWLLRRMGIKTDLKIGTRKKDGQFQAHAWIEYKGRLLNTNPKAQKRYNAFEHSFTERRTVDGKPNRKSA